MLSVDFLYVCWLCLCMLFYCPGLNVCVWEVVAFLVCSVMRVMVGIGLLCVCVKFGVCYCDC